MWHWAPEKDSEKAYTVRCTTWQKCNCIMSQSYILMVQTVCQWAAIITLIWQSHLSEYLKTISEIGSVLDLRDKRKDTDI